MCGEARSAALGPPLRWSSSWSLKSSLELGVEPEWWQIIQVHPTSGWEPVLNHSKLCSGAELRLPLAPGGLDLSQVLEVVRQEAAAFTAD